MAEGEEDVQRETKRGKCDLNDGEKGKGESPLLSRRSAIPPNTIPPSAPMSSLIYLILPTTCESVDQSVVDRKSPNVKAIVLTRGGGMKRTRNFPDAANKA